MEKLFVEFNGSMREVTVDQFKTLVKRGFVSQNARMKVDGQECRVSDYMQLQAPGATDGVPSGSPSVPPVVPPVVLPVPPDVPDVVSSSYTDCA